MEDTSPLGNPPVPPRGPINWNVATTFQSPFFWLVVGAAAVIAFQYASKRQAATHRMRNVTNSVGE